MSALNRSKRRAKRPSIVAAASLQRLALIVLIVGAPARLIAAPVETVIADLYGGLGGDTPLSPVIRDKGGSLYFTASSAQSNRAMGRGGVLRLSPPAAGQTNWTVLYLYLFRNGSEGAKPTVGLVMDPKGNLYGATVQGNNGVAFVLTPPAGGGTPWNFTPIATLNGLLAGPFIRRTNGDLIGATSAGIIFKLSPPPQGQSTWTQTQLFAFEGAAVGSGPNGGLLTDKAGALYGVTGSGGNSLDGDGVVYKLTPPVKGKGQWTEQVLYNFQGGPTDGESPVGTLVRDTAGVLYGATAQGGAGNMGTVFQLVPPVAGQTAWTETIIQGLTQSANFIEPLDGVTLGPGGALYGTTVNGGMLDGGVAYKLTPPAKGATSWAFSVLHAFPGSTRDGAHPYASLLRGPGGTLYGTTAYGGLTRNCKAGCGTVFQIQP